jgi:hypothetical protein
MAVELFFLSIARGLNPWAIDKKKAGTYSLTRSFYEGTRPEDFKKELKIIKIKARVILEHSSPIVEFKF